jgi:hypothetical protein
MSHDNQILKELLERRAGRDALRHDAEARVVWAWRVDELTEVWRAAQDEATSAYEHWCDEPCREAYAVYRAAQDRADEAQDTLWQQHILSTPYREEPWAS